MKDDKGKVIPLPSSEREHNYVQQKFPYMKREFCYGLKYLTPKQLKRIRKKQRHNWRQSDGLAA